MISYTLTVRAPDNVTAHRLLTKYLEAGLLMAEEETMETVVRDGVLRQQYLNLVEQGTLYQLAPECDDVDGTCVHLPIYASTADQFGRRELTETAFGRQMRQAKLS